MAENYTSPPVGHEVSCVMEGISGEILNNKSSLMSIMKTALEKDNFHILKTIFQSFSPQGFTGVFILSESHLAFHTYPEHWVLYLNMYSCRGPKDAEKTFNFIKKKLNPKKTRILSNHEVPLTDGFSATH